LQAIDGAGVGGFSSITVQLPDCDLTHQMLNTVPISSAHSLFAPKESIALRLGWDVSSQLQPAARPEVLFDLQMSFCFISLELNFFAVSPNNFPPVPVWRF